MVTGRRAFEGKSTAKVVAAIMTTEPPALTTLSPLTPASLERVVKKCLAKDPDERWQSASDLAAELKWIAEGGSQSDHPLPQPVHERAIVRVPAKERLTEVDVRLDEPRQDIAAAGVDDAIVRTGQVGPDSGNAAITDRHVAVDDVEAVVHRQDRAAAD